MKKNQEQINTYNKISNKNHYTLQKKNINKIIDEKSIKYIRQLNSNKKEIKKEKTINDNKSNKNNEENSIYENTDE